MLFNKYGPKKPRRYYARVFELIKTMDSENDINRLTRMLLRYGHITPRMPERDRLFLMLHAIISYLRHFTAKTSWRIYNLSKMCRAGVLDDEYDSAPLECMFKEITDHSYDKSIPGPALDSCEDFAFIRKFPKDYQSTIATLYLLTRQLQTDALDHGIMEDVNNSNDPSENTPETPDSVTEESDNA